MDYKQFGKTGETVYVVGLGTYGYGDAYGGISRNDALHILNVVSGKVPKNVAFLVDTPPLYGRGLYEEWIGEFLRSTDRRNILVATKGGRHIESDRMNEKDFTCDFLRGNLERSRERLGVDEVFLYQLHNPPLEIITEGKVFDLLEEVRDAGQIRFYGVSINNQQEGLAAIRVCAEKGYKGLASLQIVYNILNKNGYELLFETAGEANVAIIAREPLLRGFLTDRYGGTVSPLDVPPAKRREIQRYGWENIQSKVSGVRRVLHDYGIADPLSMVAVKFVASRPFVTVTIPGTNRRQYVAQNVNAAAVSLPERLLLDLTALPDINPCWETAGTARIAVDCL